MRLPLPKIRELAEAVRAVVKGPFTTRFPKKVDSVHPNFRGILKFRDELCICCGACSQVCPTDARELILDRQKGVMRIVHHADRCIYCAQCVKACPTQAIYHTPEFDLSRTERGGWDTFVEKELVCCEMCGEPFATRAQLLHIAHKVGDLVNANPTLLLTLYQQLGVAVPETAPATVLPYRSGTMRILCPDCRRKVYMTEQWGY
ncbi:MAG: 4Fe-4S dicluster domain-containing protein [candidate division WOR-3 bacterium]|jgi:hydrogenase-4 component H